MVCLYLHLILVARPRKTWNVFRNTVMSTFWWARRILCAASDPAGTGREIWTRMCSIPTSIILWSNLILINNILFYYSYRYFSDKNEFRREINGTRYLNYFVFIFFNDLFFDEMFCFESYWRPFLISHLKRRRTFVKKYGYFILIVEVWLSKGCNVRAPSKG